MTDVITPNILLKMLRQEKLDEPVLQVLWVRQVKGQDRYRLNLSDSVHNYPSCMLAVQQNNLVDDGSLSENCLVKLEKWTTNQIVKPGSDLKTSVLIIAKIQVVKEAIAVGHKLGNPVQLEDRDIANTNTTVPVSNPQHQSTTVVSNGSATTSRTQAHQQQQQQPTVGSVPSVIHPIASITPYQNKWCIKGRVTNKSPIRHFTNSRGDGKVFSVDLVDSSGEIRATGFTNEADRLYNMLEQNQVYYISKGQIKPANKKFSSIPNDYEIVFNQETTIIPSFDASNDTLPHVSYSFKTISSLREVPKDHMVDVIGIMVFCSDVQQITSKATQRELKKRDIHLLDKSGFTVSLTLWGTEADQFDAHGHPVVALKGARVGDFGGVNLSTVSSTGLVVDPDISQAHELRGWYDTEGKDVTPQTLSNVGSGGGGSGAAMTCFGLIEADQLGWADKADYVTVKGTIVAIKKDNIMYRACVSEQCNKKVVDQGNGQYRCEKCRKDDPNFRWRLLASIELSDSTGFQWVTCFQDTAEILLGKNAEQIGTMKEQGLDDEFDDLIRQASFKQYLFRIRIKVELYNEERKIKMVCVGAHPLDASNRAEYDKFLETEIAKMELMSDGY